MTEDGVNDATLREKFADVARHVKNGIDLQFRTGSAYGQAIIWASERLAELEAGPLLLASPDSDEEIYQRRRRERLLDEITLLCVSKEIEKMGDDSGFELETGFRARDIANDIWAGINEFDLQL